VQIDRLEREQVVARPLDEVFRFFSMAANLERLTPPWLRFSVVTPEPIEMRSGTLIDYRLRVRGVPIRWRSRIEEWHENAKFVDRQLRGPYRLWHHTHEFESDGDRTLVRDRVDYALPFGPLGEVAHRVVVARDLRRIFDYRREVVGRLLR
jgi:ligand-binding SRPBCC domain-containing protein